MKPIEIHKHQIDSIKNALHETKELLKTAKSEGNAEVISFLSGRANGLSTSLIYLDINAAESVTADETLRRDYRQLLNEQQPVPKDDSEPRLPESYYRGDDIPDPL